MKNIKIFSDLESEEKYIYNVLKKCIENVLEEQKSILFYDEGDFHLSLCIELKKYLKNLDNSIQIIVEYNCLNYEVEDKNLVKNNETIKGSNEIDIVLIINNNHYVIEIKYSAYIGTKCERGTVISDILNSKKKGGSYISDNIKINDLVNKNNCIKCGYCILIVTSVVDQYCSSFFDRNNVMIEYYNTKGIYSYYIKKINLKNNR